MAGPSSSSMVTRALIQKDGGNDVARTPKQARARPQGCGRDPQHQHPQGGPQRQAEPDARCHRRARQRRPQQFSPGGTGAGGPCLLAQGHRLHDGRQLERRVGQCQHENRHHHQRGAQRDPAGRLAIDDATARTSFCALSGRAPSGKEINSPAGCTEVAVEAPRWQRAVRGQLDVLMALVGPSPAQVPQVVIDSYWDARYHRDPGDQHPFARCCSTAL
jgi:hypothetical protein